MHFNSQGKQAVTYDAIVIGTGISGGYAAMELCNRGLKTLLLERGRMVRHGEYPTANDDPWDLEYRGAVPAEEKARKFSKQSRLSWWVQQDNKHWVNDDSEYDYDEDNRFDWIRGHHVGGRSIMWGRHCYRWSENDFTANAREGVAVDWPIRYADIEPWYDKVEKFVGVSGNRDGLAAVPDGQFLPAFDLNCAEEHFSKKVSAKYPHRHVIAARTANLSSYDPAVHLGTRGQCRTRNRCWRGCPLGGYFSSLSSTIPVAQATGNLTLRADSIVTEIIYDDATQRATGVRVMDNQTGEELEFFARIIFCNASTVGSTSILLNSRSERFPDGLGNDSGELGHNLMDHHYGMGASAVMPGFEDKYFRGNKPTGGFYIPRFRNTDDPATKVNYLRGFGYQGGVYRGRENDVELGPGIKERAARPGTWRVAMTCFGELLPYHENRMYLNFEKLDARGQPTITFDAKLRENEYALREDGIRCAQEMLEAAGCTDISTYNEETAPGACIHEMGTARMGRDPKTSVLNQWNQVHAVPNVFVTDGSFMTSAGTQNPSITYMAMTARAVDHAYGLLDRNEL
ncbi:MAG: GMC family oxidoreductase [Saprospiraceae bacterium]